MRSRNIEGCHQTSGPSEERELEPKGEERTKLYQCPKCPCLFTVKQWFKKGQLCLCCTRDSRESSPGQPVDKSEESAEAHCYRDGQDHTGISCDMCSIKVKSYNDLLYHLATHDANIFRCKFCNFVTTSHAAIEDHQDVHVSDLNKKCICNICGFKTNAFSKLQAHIKRTHQNIKEILLKCSECGYSTKSESALRNHMWTHIKSGSVLQPSNEADNTLKRQKSVSPSRSDAEESSDLENTLLRRKQRTKSSLSPELIDSNTKLFKCLLCGYLCEKLSTLKAHAWRHAGQEGCSYPVMHKVEDISQVTSLEDSEDHKDTSEDKADEYNFVEIIRDKENNDTKVRRTDQKSGCHCQPIVLPKEEHEIVQKVFADASAEVGSSSKASATAVQEDPPSAPSAPAGGVTKVPADTTVPELSETQTCCSSEQGDTQIKTGSCCAKPAEGVCPSPVLSDIACPEVIVEEIVTTDTADSESEGKEPQILHDVVVVDMRTSEESDVGEKSCKNLKRKVSIQTLVGEKKQCLSPGISKMLLSAVDTALQVRAESEKKSKITQGTPIVGDKDVVTAPKGTQDDHYRCPICRQVFPASVQTHVCSQGSTPIFKCHKCPATFWHFGRLQSHMGTHKAILECVSCSTRWGSEMALREHVKKAHLPAKSNICPSCQNTITEKSPKAHEQSCVLKCWYGCRECDIVTKSMEELQRHYNTAHQKPYKCSVCDYASATPNGIKNHMKFHKTDKPYKCNLCDFSGAYPQSLRSHMKKHSASAVSQSNDQYKCKFCSYTSGHLPSMKSHMWRHTSEPGYDYDGQDIIKMVVKVNNPSEENANSPERVILKTPVEVNKVGKVSPKPALASSQKKAKALLPSARKEPARGKQIQYGSVIFQCSQCGFKSNDHGCLVEHLKEHLVESGDEKI